MRSSDFPDRVSTTVLTIEEGCKQIDDTPGPGIVVVQVHSRPATFALDVHRILGKAEQLIQGYPKVVQVVLLVDIIEDVEYEGDDAVRMRTRVLGVSNPVGEKKSDSILREILTSKLPPRNSSLLDY